MLYGDRWDSSRGLRPDRGAGKDPQYCAGAAFSSCTPFDHLSTGRCCCAVSGSLCLLCLEGNWLPYSKPWDMYTLKYNPIGDADA